MLESLLFTDVCYDVNVDGVDWAGGHLLVDTFLVGHLARSLCMYLCVILGVDMYTRIRYYIRHFIYPLGIPKTLFPHLMEQICGYSYESLRP